MKIFFTSLFRSITFLVKQINKQHATFLPTSQRKFLQIKQTPVCLDASRSI